MTNLLYYSLIKKSKDFVGVRDFLVLSTVTSGHYLLQISLLVSGFFLCITNKISLTIKYSVPTLNTLANSDCIDPFKAIIIELLNMFPLACLIIIKKILSI